ncbi:hypothetical protein ACLMAJ_26170 [Nocardia sp. KC 131]|uniref:hypothetical protein n=1 Tax=Nocardia arseniciresistens TaxID=3392119 RepID=UPI00398F5B82
MAENWARHLHPDTALAIKTGKAVEHAIDEMLERVDQIRARRPSPSSRVIPEVDGVGRLTDLYISPGTIANSGSSEALVADIMAAIHDSTVDALRQHKNVIRETTLPTVPWPRP